MIARLLCVTTFAGCNAIFGLRDVVRTPDAPDAPPATCTNPSSLYDTFDETSGAPCASWGYNEQLNCSTTVANSQLIMTPVANAPGTSRCGCGSLSAMTFTAQSGTFVEVSAVARGATEYTEFYAFWEGGGEASAIGYGNGKVIFERSGGTMFGSVPYDASSRWWRIRPSDDGTTILGEASPDGATWTTIGIDPGPPPAQIRTAFVVGTFGVEAMSTTATIERINVCP